MVERCGDHKMWTRYPKNWSPPPYEWCEIVKDHKGNGRYDEAPVVLAGCIRVEEAHSGGVAPWYYEHAAIIHRKRRDRDAELAVLRSTAACTRRDTPQAA